MTDATQGFGQQDPADSVGSYNPFAFAIAQKLARISSAKIVKVLAVDTTAHTVSVQIAVNQLDGQNNATPHGEIFGIPYVWVMGGTNAFEIDPAVGDLGVMVVSDRDISAVKNTKAIANPGSLRKFSPSDGIYLFGIPSLNGQAPTQFFKWISGGGYNITDSFGNVQSSSNAGISINGVIFDRSKNIHTTATITGDTDVIAAGKSGKSHLHSGVTTGGGDSGPPV